VECALRGAGDAACMINFVDHDLSELVSAQQAMGYHGWRCHLHCKAADHGALAVAVSLMIMNEQRCVSGVLVSQFVRFCIV
jgi:hypothetical protein